MSQAILKERKSEKNDIQSYFSKEKIELIKNWIKQKLKGDYMSQAILKERKSEKNDILKERKSEKNDIQSYFSKEKIELIKNLYCKNASDEELSLFLMICKKVQLDPCAKQIYAVFRKNNNNKSTMTIQTGIDGYRLIADRTGKYAPGRDTEFGYDKNGSLLWARAYVKKMTPDGTWHEISSTAFWDEYVVMYQNKPSTFWANKSHIMLAKCAEALALRKTFPAELSGLYTADEMGNISEEMGNISENEKNNVLENPEISCSEKPIEIHQIETIKRIIKTGYGDENKILKWYLTKYKKNNDGNWGDFSSSDAVLIIDELIKIKNKKNK